MEIKNNIINPLSSPASQKAGIDKDAQIDKKILEKAQEFESVFIAESLKQAHISGMPKSSGGDTLITDTFDSFMNKAIADGIVKKGGFGIAEHIAKALIQNNQ